MTQIPNDTFANCTNLETLDLSKNKLRFLNASTFRGLGKLISLVLSENQLYEVHFKTFSTLKNLTTLYIDNNMFPSLPSRTLDYMPKLENVKLSNNPWHCDCHTLYISAWVRLNEMKIWDYSPTCISPWYLEGHFLKKLKFPELCSGQWASMVNLSPRLPMQQLLALNVTVNRKPQRSLGDDEDVTSEDQWK
ncbi:unnamed protein product [Parnassius mnemosyne]|uniref:LRRCT domain-containing protein n=1 Tax=Parnassius mnemosyne TaxID=213953 RepID=A0AAV1MB74_9NEOP